MSREPLDSLPSLIASTRPFAPVAVCPPALLEPLARIPDVLGPSLAWALYECRLAGAPRVDSAVLLSAGLGRTRVRDRLFEAPSLWPGRWTDAGRALVAWLLPGHPVSEARQLSLEWDCQPDPGLPFPFVTFELAPGVPTAPERALSIAEALAEVVDERALTRHDTRVVSALPPNGSTLHFGCLGRRGAGARRWVSGMPAAQVEAFLRDVEWRGDRALVGRWARSFGAHAPHVSVHLDVGEGIGPRVGLEFFYPGPPRVDRRWSPLFVALEAYGLATAEALEGLRDWPGASSGLTRLLDLKVVFEDRPVEAKAYLAFCPTDQTPLTLDSHGAGISSACQAAAAQEVDLSQV